MRADVVRAERFKEVRDAARGWADAVAIDEATRVRVDERYPDDRVRLKLWLRIVAAVAAFIGGGAAAGLAWAVLGGGTSKEIVLAVALAAAFTLATEWQVGPLRRAQSGIEWMTALFAVVFACWSVADAFEDVGGELFLVTGTVLCLLAASRWGFPFFAGIASLLAYGWLAFQAHGRAGWLLSSLILIPIADRASRSGRLAPSHRRCFEVALALALVVAYVAVNLWSLDKNVVELIGDRPTHGWPGWIRFASGAATALWPAAVLLAGVVRRSRIGLVLGTVFLVASLATLRHYRPIGPLWLMLTLGGTVCLVVALALRRWIESGPARERDGFIADALFEPRGIRELARVVGVVATLSPAPRAAPGDSFKPGGGVSGGGGATGSY